MEPSSGSEYGAFEQAQELSAYRELRDLVLTRRISALGAIEPVHVADELDVSEGDVLDALRRLRLEGVVSRQPSGVYVVSPITMDVASGLFDARAAIEVGVVTTNISRIDRLTLHALRETAERLARLVSEPLPDLERFLDASRQYHLLLVGAAGSAPLTDAYDRLNIAAVWREHIRDVDWWNLFDIDHHGVLTEALTRQDLEAALEAIFTHSAQVTDLVRQLIDRTGGSL